RAQHTFDLSSVYDWQLEACRAILEKRDCILSAPTGGGKTLAFYLPLLAFYDPTTENASNQPITLIVSPLVELMNQQANDLNEKGIPAVALCGDNLRDKGLTERFGQGEFRVGFISPETVNSPFFNEKVLSCTVFKQLLVAVCYDEGHTILEWGGSFRPDFLASCELLRGRLPVGLPVLVASATLSRPLVQELYTVLKIGERVSLVQFSNARPNISLSVRCMKYPKTFGDLYGLLPELDTLWKAEDIPTTLVYFNTKPEAEKAADFLRMQLPEEIPHSAVAFYTADVGETRKREIIEGLSQGLNLRNIQRVVLWRIPPSFASLIQRAGRAARVQEELGEMILFVESCWYKKNAAGDADVNGMGEDGEVATSRAEMRPPTRSQRTTSVQLKRDTPSAELDRKFLRAFIQTESCRHIPWDEFYENSKKREYCMTCTMNKHLPSYLRHDN
ncbi:hypothetical protein M422DRAFT_193886, partial [Sphaerobolus stellatus SS14]